MNAVELNHLRETILALIQKERENIFEPYSNLVECLDSLEEVVDSTMMEAILNQEKVDAKK